MNPPPHERLTPSADHAHMGADAQAFEAFAQTQSPLDLEAATWLVRRRQGLDAAGMAALREWLASDPRHAVALDGMAATLAEVRQLPRAAVAAGPVHPAHSSGPANPARRQWLRGWAPAVPQAAMAVAVLGGGWMGWAQWREQATYEQAFATQRGQQRTVRLPDTYAQGPGSTLQLDTATRLQARLYRDRREVRLADGQALFSVQPDRERPFEVWAGALRITVVGTRFSVRHTASGLDAGQTVIAVEEGLVRVARADPGAGTVELTAGQRVVASGAGHISPVASVPASAIAAWRNGRISFDQTPLAQAIAEFERYGPTGLVVRDPAVAELPVGGSYSVHQWQRFAAALPLVLPVRLEPHGDRTDIVAL